MPDAFTEAKNLAQATIGLGPGSITPKDDAAGQAGAMDAQAAVKRLVQNPLAVAAITAAVVLGGQALMKWSAPVAPPAVSVAQTTNGGQAIPANVLYDLLATGQTSPRGVSARDVTGQRAQELAAQALQKPGAARDIAEAQFWLKRAATTANGQDRSARVLTELGTLYAETRQEPGPDYATARSLWEIAAAMGDAGAAYFLGQLHEHGLGVAQDTRAALTWYERAKTLGTFPGVDDAVTRVKGKSG
jgi:TPR repeat protein